MVLDREYSEKSNLRCCQSFLNSFRDFRDPRNQINQVPPEIINFRQIYRWAKRGTASNGHEKRNSSNAEIHGINR